ncbi:hypothetical protein ACIO7M_01835 [Streptomyces toxytricini]|uniref:Lipoprotein n=1 Tax=Streptomyces toxytricini TaxID=67369 RepID=A0ABW8E9E5_STRT5
MGVRVRRAAGALLAGAVVLAGCTLAPDDKGGPSTPPTSAPPTTAGPSTPPPASPTAPAPAPPPSSPTPAPAPDTADKQLVTATRSGGYAGKTTSLLVNGDGSWVRLDGRARPAGSGRLSPKGLADLEAALGAADFPRLPRVSTGRGTVYDGFTYAFVHGGREVAAADGSIPAGLRPVLAALPPFEAD